MNPRALPIVVVTIASWTACGRIGYDELADNPGTDMRPGGSSPSGTGLGGTIGAFAGSGGAGIDSTGTTEAGSGGTAGSTLSTGAGASTASSSGSGPGGQATGGSTGAGGVGATAGGGASSTGTSAGTMAAGGRGGGGAAGGGGASGGGSASGSGGGSGGGGGGASGSAGAAGGATNLDLIDDLEDGNAAIRGIAQPARNGVWDTSNDMSPGGVQSPAPTMFAPVALGADVPYAQDRFAAYTKGSGFTAYGAFMNVTMRSWPIYAQAPTYNASGYIGLSFWAKVGPASTRTLRVRFVSADTDDRGGRCSKTGPVGQLCYNHFYLDLPLTTSWQRSEIRFANFVQTNTGKIYPAIDLAEMYGLEFYFLSGATFELWVDDLSFIRK
jgi:hypothetical protein